MSRVEHPFVLDPETDQRIDIEEAPITKIARGHPPVRDAIVLLLEKLVQPIGIGIQLRYDLVNGTCGNCVIVQQLRQHFSEQLLVPMPPRNTPEISRGWRWQFVEAIGEKRQCIAAANHRGWREYLLQRARRDRKHSVA